MNRVSMELETIDKLFLELSQVSRARTQRELTQLHLINKLVTALQRQKDSHDSIAMLMDSVPSDLGLKSVRQQSRKFADEARSLLDGLDGVRGEVMAPAPLPAVAPSGKPDWRIGLTVKTKYRTHERYYERGTVRDVHPDGTNGIHDKAGVLRIEIIGGPTILEPADNWVTA